MHLTLIRNTARIMEMLRQRYPNDCIETLHDMDDCTGFKWSEREPSNTVAVYLTNAAICDDGDVAVLAEWIDKGWPRPS